MIDDLERYAEIAAALAATEDRVAVLSRYGLTEESWEALDEAFQAQLSDAVNDFDGDGVPEEVARFSDAYHRAKERLATTEVMPFEQYVAATRVVHRGQDIPHGLNALGITFDAYIRAGQYWMARVARDPVLAEQLRRALT